MLNKQAILNLASKFMSPEKVNNLAKAFDTTSNIMNMANNPQEALNKAGITGDDINKIEGYLNNPMAKLLLGPLGVDTTEAKRVINQLKGSSQTEQAPVSELDSLEKTLKSIR